LGRRAHLRLAASLQAAADPLRPPPRNPRSIPRDRLLPRLLQTAPTLIVIRVLRATRYFFGMEELRITRRASLARFGGLLAAALAGGGWRVQEAASEGVGPAGVASGGVSCVLAPEQTEGPYYIADEKLRRNITEGKPGTPLTLNLRVVEASTCKAIKGAVVDIWHADASGVYSGFGQGSSNRTFLRGIQKTDAAGL